MYNNLRAELARIGRSTADTAKIIGISERAAYNKIYGRTDFTISEAMKLRNALFPWADIEYLFGKGERNDNQNCAAESI